jgi:hypothetical protein
MAAVFRGEINLTIKLTLLIFYEKFGHKSWRIGLFQGEKCNVSENILSA